MMKTRWTNQNARSSHQKYRVRIPEGIMAQRNLLAFVRGAVVKAGLIIACALCSSCASLYTTKYTEEQLQQVSPPAEIEIPVLVRRMNKGLLIPIRIKSAQRLSLSEHSLAAEALAEKFVRRGDGRVVAELRNLLEERYRPACVPVLIEALEKKNWKYVQRACWILGRYREQNAAERLIEQMDRDDWRVRLAVAWALGSIAEGEVDNFIGRELTARLIEEDVVVVQYAIAKALERCGDTEAIPVLLKIAKEETENGHVQVHQLWSMNWQNQWFLGPARPLYSTGSAAVRSLAAITVRGMKDDTSMSAFFVEKVKAQGLEGVAPVYEILVALGEEGAESILLEALENTGNETMALDFLESGNEKLAEGAKAWLASTRLSRGAKKTLRLMAGALGGALEMQADAISYRAQRASWGDTFVPVAPDRPWETLNEGSWVRRRHQEREEANRALKDAYARPSGAEAAPTWRELRIDK